jgi:tetratricopeptide (TPR) repeat protein
MAVRLLSTCLWLLVVAVTPASDPIPSALKQWEQGQEAMRQGRNQEAIACFLASLKLDPGLARNHLSLAAAYLDTGEEERACSHLARYVAAEPGHLIVRGHYAELLLRVGRRQDAREQFEDFVAGVQEREELAAQHLVHCHSRLMEIAEAEEDDYGEHLHRGIGLYHLACQRARLPDPEGELSTEGLLCKAAAELQLARGHRRGEAQPCWYLHEVWARLGRQQPAARWLREAEANAPFSYLTPVERNRLHLACLALPGPRK